MGGDFGKGQDGSIGQATLALAYADILVINKTTNLFVDVPHYCEASQCTLDKHTMRSRSEAFLRDAPEFSGQ